MELKGSKTEQNLITALKGEALAYTKYTIFAKQAAKDGYQQIAAIFNETADNEHTHAKIWLKELNGGSVPDTDLNLKAAIEGEKYEWSDMYVGFAKEAREEGFTRLARLFEMVGAIEKTHEDRYDKLLRNVETKQVFKKDEDRVWMCRECGHIHYGKEAPEKCPVCGHPQAYFEIHPDNY